MKLYATTTSERATSGQGGNQFLKIMIQAGKDRRHIVKLYITESQTKPDQYLIIIDKTNKQGDTTGESFLIEA